MLESFAKWLVCNVFSIKPETLLSEAMIFFIYDTIKIFLLLFVIIFIVSIIRSYIPQEKVREILSKKKQFYGNILAAMLGIITPFCTCSAIPLFL